MIGWEEGEMRGVGQNEDSDDRMGRRRNKGVGQNEDSKNRRKKRREGGGGDRKMSR